MSKPKTEAEKIQWCGEQVKIAKEQAPEKYKQFEALVKAEMKKSKVGALEAAINLSMQVKDDTVMHLWFMGVASCLIENEEVSV